MIAKLLPFLALPLLFVDAAAGQDLADLGSLKYRNIGPSRGGRATAVCGDVQNLGTFYMGATGGGVWKTEDYGRNWSNISDGFFQSPSIGAIRVATTDSDLIWVGTGSDGIRSNVIPGRGIYKSKDAGEPSRLSKLLESRTASQGPRGPQSPARVDAADPPGQSAPRAQAQAPCGRHRAARAAESTPRSWAQTGFLLPISSTL